MASLQERRGKNGKLTSFTIKVFRGRDAAGKQLKPFTTSFKVSPTWSEKSARKKAEAFAATFERDCLEGRATDCRKTFEQYCEYCLELKESRGAKATTIASYRYLASRIYPEIGHIQLSKLRVEHLNKLYTKLQESGSNKRDGGKLSAKTVRKYHTLIELVLQQAVKEGLVAQNVSLRADLPKILKHEANYYEPEKIAQIVEALEDEPPKWSMLVHLLLITGCRRGEVLGLHWSDIDFKNCLIHISRSIAYLPARGVYETTPKTEKSNRTISVPADTISRLKKYRAIQAAEILQLGEYYERNDYIFSQDNGKPMHPDSVSKWLTHFGERHNLGQVNAHAFRHSMASILIYNGVDVLSVSHRLGHSQTSTTSDIYGHILKSADQRNAEILSSVLLKKA